MPGAGWDQDETEKAMRYVTTTYTPHTHRAAKSLPCPVCGKKVRRQRTFTMTASPFNKNPDGTVRTVPEIYAALREKAKAWEAEPVTHPKCEEKS